MIRVRKSLHIIINEHKSINRIEPEVFIENVYTDS